jgi:2'-hydroxyisoflavone reductase
MLAAGDPDELIQPVDVRDVARFTLDRLEHGTPGTYNVVPPRGLATRGDLLAACVAAAGAGAEVRWVGFDRLARQDVDPATVPLWHPEPGTWQVDAGAARAAGLLTRPVHHTVSDTWAWLRAEPPQRQRPGPWIDPDREVALLLG